MPELDHRVFCDEYVNKTRAGQQPSPMCINPPVFDEYSRWHDICKSMAEDAEQAKKLAQEQKKKKNG